MTCKEFSAHFKNDFCAAGRFLTEPSELSEHLASCPECNRSVLEQKELARSLHALRDSAPPVSSSLDRAVLVNYRRYMAERLHSARSAPFASGTSLRRAWGWAAIFALAIVGVYTGMLALMPPGQRRVDRNVHERPLVVDNQMAAKVKKTAVAQKPAPNGMKRTAASSEKRGHPALSAEQNTRFPTRFQSLMYCDQLSCPGAMDVIRLELPSPVLGLTAASARENGLVSADVLVGPDGIARGIRVVQ